MKNAILAGAAIAALTTAAEASVKINEFEPNPVGADAASQQFEFLGTPGEFFSGWVLSIEADNISAAGTVDRASTFSGTFDANGLLLVSIPDLENPSNTVLLTDTFTGSVGDDLDTDNDGVIDDTGNWNEVLDAIAILDTASDFSYASQLGGTDFPDIGDEPRLVFRDSVTMDWFAINDVSGDDDIFDQAGDIVTAAFDPAALGDTFGAINPTQVSQVIPVPAAALLFAPALAMLRRRRG